MSSYLYIKLFIQEIRSKTIIHWGPKQATVFMIKPLKHSIDLFKNIHKRNNIFSEWVIELFLQVIGLKPLINLWNNRLSLWDSLNVLFNQFVQQKY